MSSKIFITGGTGFVGAYIIQALVEKGHSVKAMRRNKPLPFFIPAPVFQQVEWVDGDIMDTRGLEEAMEGMDAVIHAAAKVSYAAQDRQELFRTNIEGTANMVNAALSQNVRRFVHISSVAAIGRTSDGELITEENHWNEGKGNTNYAISKYFSELEVWRAIAEGLPACIVNPAMILGYGDWKTSSCALFRNSFREFPWYSNGVKGFVDVEDVARAVVALLEDQAWAEDGERFILSGDNWSFRQLFTTIAKEFGKSPPSKEATPFLGAIAWRLEKLKSIFTGRPPLVTKETARMAQTQSRFDNTKILRRLPGFSFTPLPETIRKACKAYLEHPQEIR